jgi:hypothetical protein
LWESVPKRSTHYFLPLIKKPRWLPELVGRNMILWDAVLCMVYWNILAKKSITELKTTDATHHCHPRKRNACFRDTADWGCSTTGL